MTPRTPLQAEIALMIQDAYLRAYTPPGMTATAIKPSLWMNELADAILERLSREPQP